jgi:hypothetical protein
LAPEPHLIRHRRERKQESVCGLETWLPPVPQRLKLLQADLLGAEAYLNLPPDVFFGAFERG